MKQAEPKIQKQSPIYKQITTVYVNIRVILFTLCQVYLVLWYKVAGAGDEGEPIYSYDARHGTWNLGARWSDERHGFGERAYFQLSSSPAELRLEDVTGDEAGLYRCRVDFKVSGTL